MRIFYGLISIVTIFFTNSYSQPEIDSLLYKLESTQGNSRVEILNELSETLAYQDYDRSIFYARIARNLSDSLNYSSGKAYALHNLAFAYYLKGDFHQSIEFNLSSYQLADEISDNILLLRIYDILARTYEEMNVLDKSLDFYIKGDDLNAKLGNVSGQALSLHGTARIYTKTDRFQLAIESHKNALELFKVSDNYSGLAKTYILLGQNYYDIEEPDSVIFFFNKANFEINQLSDPALLLDLYLAKSKLFEEYNLDSAIYYLLNSLKIVDDMGRAYMQVEILNGLSELYSKSGDYAAAQSYHIKYAALNDSLINENNTVLLNEQKENITSPFPPSIDPESEKENAIRTQNIILAGGGIVIIIALFILFLRRYKFQKGSYQLIEEMETDLQALTNDIKKKEEIIYQLKENKQYLKEQNTSLRNMLTEKDKIENPERSIQEILEEIAENINSDWAGIWLFKEGGRRLICYDEYDAKSGVHHSGESLSCTDYPTYFDVIRSSEWLEVSNCREDIRTGELVKPRFENRNIFSKLDIPLIDLDKQFGILMIESSELNLKRSDKDLQRVTATCESIVQLFLEFERKKDSGKKKDSQNGSWLNQGMNNDSERIYGVRDLDGKIIEISQSVESILGYSPGEFQGRNYLEYVNSDFVGMVVDYQEKIRNNDFPQFGFKYQIKDANGESLILSERVISVLHDHDSILLCFELKRILDWRDEIKVYKDQDHRIRKILGSLHSPLILIDDRQTIIMANPAVEKMLGYTSGELNGRQIEFILSTDDISYDEIKQAITKTMIEQSSEAMYFEHVVIKSKMGTRLEIPLTSYLMENDSETNIIFEFSNTYK